MPRQYLDVPYKSKDAAKALGARFDGAVKRWYVEAGTDLVAFTAWLPAGAAPAASASVDLALAASSTEIAITRKGIPLDCAARHFENTGRYLQVWGELGEIYAEIKFGLRRHATNAPGSDGTIDGKRVEVKTISPEKTSDHVLVKSQGNFEKLLIIRIDRGFQFQGKLIDRSELSGGLGKYLKGRLPRATQLQVVANRLIRRHHVDELKGQVLAACAWLRSRWIAQRRRRRTACSGSQTQVARHSSASNCGADNSGASPHTGRLIQIRPKMHSTAKKR